MYRDPRKATTPAGMSSFWIRILRLYRCKGKVPCSIIRSKGRVDSDELLLIILRWVIRYHDDLSGAKVVEL